MPSEVDILCPTCQQPLIYDAFEDWYNCLDCGFMSPKAAGQKTNPNAPIFNLRKDAIRG